MKRWKILSLLVLTATTILLLSFSFRRVDDKVRKKSIGFVPPKGCVFRTVMGEEADSTFVYKSPAGLSASLSRGLSWMVQAQNTDGGWGAGSHSRQDIKDPHAVASDPATTSMVAMALLRTGSTLNTGQNAPEIKKALNYILESIENSSAVQHNITTITGTQIQTKLGANIDVVLAAQFLADVIDHANQDAALKTRIQKALDVCVGKIQKAQDANGNMVGAGWAGVLQSSFATNALEAAETKGARVDAKALEKSREAQKKNYDPKSGNVNTDMGAGVVLYSVTGSARASAKEARKVKEELSKAKAAGTLAQTAPVTAENLEKIGYDKDDALKYATAYQVYESAKVQAQRDDVMSGFGNNGGEEFLSYLQTGESMVIGKDESWKKWFDTMSGRLINIQNNDGSWNGHHCITSPVFCTATCLLILSINNDIDKLVRQGAK